MKDKMRFLFFSILLIGLWRCSISSEKGKSSSVNKVDDPSVSKQVDLPTQVKQQPEDSFPHALKLIIYPFYKNHFENEFEAGFIPLADTYIWSDHLDSLAVESKYLGNIDDENSNYHTLNGENRTGIFSRTGIHEDDQIFIYNIILDSIAVCKVEEIPLVAFMSPYGAQGSVSQYDYQFGFELKNTGLTGGYYNSLVYIGPINPFIKNGLVPITWTEIDNSLFPHSRISKQDSATLFRYGNLDTLRTYYFEHKGLEYFVQNKGHGNMASTRFVKVISSVTKEQLFVGIYNDSEGCYLLPLNGVEENDYGTVQQWTGELFKNRPPVIFGFLGLSFGCPSISFIHQPEADIRICCDNRH